MMQRALKEKVDKRFCVVSFPDEEESLYIVSSRWLQRGKSEKQYVCSWPPYKGDARITRAVLEDERPVATWHTCTAKLIKKCKTFKGAENILNAILMVSNERSRLMRGHECEPGGLPSKRIKTESDVTLSSPVYHCELAASESSSEDSSPNSPPVVYEVSEVIAENRVPSPTISSVTCSQSQATSSTYQFLLQTTSAVEETSEMTSSVPEESYTNCSSIEEKIDFLAKSLESIKRIVERNSEMLNSLQQEANGYCPNDMQNLPAETIDDLKNLNEKLSDDKEFAYLVKQLGFLGGKDQADAVRRILSRLISNDVALILNWIGGDRKRSIQEFKRVIQLVFVAVRQNKEYADTSQAIVEDCIKRWLRYAADRNGGRMKRRTVRIGRQRIVFA